MIDFEEMANSHPKMRRGMVWCRTCGRAEKVNAAHCLKFDWPRCCGYTMTIDAPDEQVINNPEAKERA